MSSTVLVIFFATIIFASVSEYEARNLPNDVFADEVDCTINDRSGHVSCWPVYFHLPIYFCFFLTCFYCIIKVEKRRVEKKNILVFFLSEVRAFKLNSYKLG